MSDSSDSSAYEDTPTVSTSVDKFIHMKPELVTAKKSKFKSYTELRSSLEKTKCKSAKTRFSARVDDRKQLACGYATDISKANTKFETL